MSILSLAYEHSPRLCRSDLQLGLILGAWGLLALGIAAGGETFLHGPTSRWLFPLMTFGPIGLFALAFAVLPGLRAWVLGLDRRFLIGIHAMRTVGVSFLFLYVYDVLPAAFAFPAGLGDLIAAVWAVWLSFGLARGAPIEDAAIARWNWFGVADFLIAVGIGTALRSVLLGGEVNTDAMGVFPLALFPLYLVPMLAITHLIIGLQLREARRLNAVAR